MLQCVKQCFNFFFCYTLLANWPEKSLALLRTFARALLIFCLYLFLYLLTLKIPFVVLGPIATVALSLQGQSLVLRHPQQCWNVLLSGRFWKKTLAQSSRSLLVTGSKADFFRRMGICFEQKQPLFSQGMLVIPLLCHRHGLHEVKSE